MRKAKRSLGFPMPNPVATRSGQQHVAGSEPGAATAPDLQSQPGCDSLSSIVVSSEPDDGTVNVHPNARPRQLPRMRRGMNRPVSTSVQAATSWPSPSCVKCGPSEPASFSFIFIKSPGLLSLVPFNPVGRRRCQAYSGMTSTSQPFDVGMPVPLVSPPISLQVGGP